jgi:hypothetical protein
VELWSVYQHPDRCAVQKILVEDDGLCPGGWETFQTLNEARRVLSRRGLIRVPRAEQDDPALVEFWV